MKACLTRLTCVRLARSARYRQTITQLDTFSESQADLTLSAFNRAVSPVLRESADRWAVSLCGSHARGDGTLCSDVDLLVITARAISSDVLMHSRRALTEAVGHANIQTYTISDVRNISPHYLPLQSLPHLRFVAGCKNLFFDWIAEADASLGRLTELDLLELLLADPRRRKDRSVSSSPHYNSIKHGPGGTLLYERVATFLHYYKVRGRSAPAILRRAMRAGRCAVTLQRVAKNALEQKVGVRVDSLLPLKNGWRIEGLRTPPSGPWYLRYATVCAVRQYFEDYWRKTEEHFVSTSQ